MHCQKRKLESNNNPAREYNAFKLNLINKDFCEVRLSEINGQLHSTWYLPYHGLFHACKNKFREVFDCSANFERVNLDSLLLPEPISTVYLLVLGRNQ